MTFISPFEQILYVVLNQIFNLIYIIIWIFVVTIFSG